MLDDWLAAEDLIVQRLKDQVPELKTVTTAADVAEIPEMRQLPSPTAIVIYDGDDVPTAPSSQKQQGMRQIVNQRWLIVVAAKNVRDQRGGSGVRRAAGPLISKVKTALSGWATGLPGTRPLAAASAPGPAFEAGFGYFPLLFTQEVFA